MGITPEAMQRIEASKKLIDQFIRDPAFDLANIHIDPHTPYLRTNNFVQQSIGRNYGFNPDDGKWYPIFSDSQGRILLSPDTSDGAHVLIKNRDLVVDTLIDAQSVPSPGAVTHIGVDVSSFAKKTLLVGSNKLVTAYIQYSDNDSDWYTLVDSTGSDYTITLDNESNAIAIDDVARFMRVIVYNTGGDTATVTVKVISQP